jgi:hypothetical protein
MPSGEAADMFARTRSRLRSSYLLRVLAGPADVDGCRYELHELRSGEVRNFESLAALRCHLGEAEADLAATSNGAEGPGAELE